MNVYSSTTESKRCVRASRPNDGSSLYSIFSVGDVVEAHPSFFRDFAYVFIAATAGGILAWRLRQPLIIGYVLAGALISPLTPGPKIEDAETLELFAEIGVILLMFSVGLEFSLKDLLRAKWVAIVGGSTGILLSILLGIAAGQWLGLPPIRES
jgi:CPA2 family monovalent cation:H+ antiporter-2